MAHTMRIMLCTYWTPLTASAVPLLQRSGRPERSTGSLHRRQPTDVSTFASLRKIFSTTTDQSFCVLSQRPLGTDHSRTIIEGRCCRDRCHKPLSTGLSVYFSCISAFEHLYGAIRRAKQISEDFGRHMHYAMLYVS